MEVVKCSLRTNARVAQVRAHADHSTRAAERERKRERKRVSERERERERRRDRGIARAENRETEAQRSVRSAFWF